MGVVRRYRNLVSDSARWVGFPFRGDDIVISTPPKCGTTWMQLLCVMLVLDAVEFDRPLAAISPWLDMQTNELAGVIAGLEAQRHRRVIKTHTPLDGLPLHPGVTYIGVGRDPRDVAVSFEHHMANLDVQAFLAARAAAVGVDDLAEFAPPPPPPADPAERFWRWAYGDADSGLATLPAILAHLQTLWDRRDEARVVLFHYNDLLADLPGQLRRLAGVLAVEVDNARLAQYAAAATFDRMRQRADELAPDVGNRIWRSNQEFFHRGYSGQWRDWLDPPALRRYHERVAELAPPDLAAWVHTGWLSAAPAGVPH
jgi:aryl sulfotransferase